MKKRNYVRDGIPAERPDLFPARRCTCGCTNDRAADRPRNTVKDSLAAAAAHAQRMTEFAARLRAPQIKGSR